MPRIPQSLIIALAFLTAPAAAQQLSYGVKEELKQAVGVCLAEKAEIGSARDVLLGRGFTAGNDTPASTAYRMRIDKAKKTDGAWTLNVKVPNTDEEPCAITVLNILPKNAKTALFHLQSHIQRLGYVSASIAQSTGRNGTGYRKGDHEVLYLMIPRGKNMEIRFGTPQ